MYSGDHPLRLAPVPGVTNPVLSPENVTDVDARFVADPFLMRADASWHMFFEVMPAAGRVAAIGHATSADGLAWRYDRLVLREAFHLSYPFVFEAGGERYLVPETHQAGAIRLYRAARFPSEWTFAATLLDGEWADPTLFPWDGRWWLMAATPARRATRLHLFHAADPSGPWREHPESPIVRDDAARARPAGRVIAHESGLLRIAQDCSEQYGRRVRAFQIVELTARRYRERDVLEPLALGPSGDGWNAGRMHHVDAHEVAAGRWLAAVDGDAGP
jgi:hypothetical protein